MNPKIEVIVFLVCFIGTRSQNRGEEAACRKAQRHEHAGVSALGIGNGTDGDAPLVGENECVNINCIAESVFADFRSRVAIAFAADKAWPGGYGSQALA